METKFCVMVMFEDGHICGEKSLNIHDVLDFIDNTNLSTVIVLRIERIEG